MKSRNESRRKTELSRRPHKSQRRGKKKHEQIVGALVIETLGVAAILSAFLFARQVSGREEPAIAESYAPPRVSHQHSTESVTNDYWQFVEQTGYIHTR